MGWAAGAWQPVQAAVGNTVGNLTFMAAEHDQDGCGSAAGRHAGATCLLQLQGMAVAEW